ncbi:DUF3540 domain-containing protein [Thiomonas sp.]|uniref:DUF3540 domain-containing protein n=1 Tax=Thiomonas sp. TaxID=2047785 RepID=UPI002601AD05|nr:DUF3540 domain-containing protein [Thiomonas sp.]
MSAVPLPRPASDESVTLARGTVVQADDDGCRVLCEHRSLAARPAASCLLRPRAGDDVLLLLGEPSPVVLAVLVREHDHGSVRLPGGAELQGDPGVLRLRTQRLDMRCGTVELRASELRALFGRLQASGREWIARLERSLLELGDSVRRVRGLDETQAAQQRVRVEGRLHMQCGDASLVARRRVRVDGDQIDLG